MSNDKRILVFTATYNEIENIRELINGIQKYLPNTSILIIDDNSPDKTQVVIKELKKKNESLFLIERERKLGLDSAHKTAFSYAIENNFDYLLTMDADLSHDPKDLPEFIKNFVQEIIFFIMPKFAKQKFYSNKLKKMTNFFNLISFLLIVLFAFTVYPLIYKSIFNFDAHLFC